jgi:Excalibur calcium-binding domain
VALPVSAEASTKVPIFKNCTAMHAKYKHGVGLTGAKDKVTSKSDKPVTNFYRSNAIYKANKKLDRDHDGIACEKH